jgi:cobalt-zinc-cadmium efflux system membrane fusion protein
VTAPLSRAAAGASWLWRCLPAGALVAALALTGCGGSPPEPAAQVEHGAGADEFPTGPNGGRLLEQEGFSVEVVLAEGDAGAEFHLYPARDGKPVAPAEVQATISARRLNGLPGGIVEEFRFEPRGAFLGSTTKVAEPHSFGIRLTARHAGKDHVWEYESPEGLVTIDPAMASTQGLTTAVAGPGVIRETVALYGSIEAVPARVRNVQARFPGIVRSVAASLGERVRSGQALATVESNETLQAYTVTAPIDGTITSRMVNPGESTDGPLFTITDLSLVHVDLTIFPRDRAKLRPGQRIDVRAAEGETTGSGVLEYIVPPVGTGGTALAHVELDNAQGQWTPGQFVTARVIVGSGEVPLVVPLAAIQAWREWDSVFVAEGDRYQVVPVRLGRRDDESAEVLEGLAPGARIVVGNSYLVKADIEKSGAAHEH